MPSILIRSDRPANVAFGTGTTSVTVLAAELLREAEKLVTLGHVHPQT